MPDSKDYLSTFKGSIGSLEKYITTDRTGRRSRDVRSPAVNAFHHIRSTVTPYVVCGTTFRAYFVVRRFAAFVRYVSVH